MQIKNVTEKQSMREEEEGRRKMRKEQAGKTGVDIDITKKKLTLLGNRVKYEIGEWFTFKLRCQKIIRCPPEETTK